MRSAEITRNTLETKVSVALNLDGEGKSRIDTGVGFLDHMLTLFSAWSGFDLTVSCQGDTQVDDHHSVEDIGISLGEAFRKALGDCRGITRTASLVLPMDEALVLIAADISGRDYLGYSLCPPSEKVGTFDTELVREFYAGFCRSARITLHLRQLDGLNSHHIIEASFKGFGRALGLAAAINEKNAGIVPSTKGVLE